MYIYCKKVMWTMTFTAWCMRHVGPREFIFQTISGSPFQSFSINKMSLYFCCFCIWFTVDCVEILMVLAELLFTFSVSALCIKYVLRVSIACRVSVPVFLLWKCWWLQPLTSGLASLTLAGSVDFGVYFWVYFSVGMWHLCLKHL